MSFPASFFMASICAAVAMSPMGLQKLNLETLSKHSTFASGSPSLIPATLSAQALSVPYSGGR